MAIDFEKNKRTAKRRALKRRADKAALKAKRSTAAKKAAATRKRNAGMKQMGPVHIKVNTDLPKPEEFTRLLREEAAKRIKTLLFARSYGATPATLERLVNMDPEAENASALVTAALAGGVAGRGVNYWRTANGEVVHVRTMSEEHLRNTVSFLTRKLGAGLGSVPFVRALQPMLDSLSAMLSECRRRGLQV